jgi:CMP-N,N'-diacetyllegionaminic acid synthase
LSKFGAWSTYRGRVLPLRILALITARGGSKRLPGKNLRSFAGRPLVVWSIAVTKGVGELSDVLVSTDDEAIASISRQAGALAPWLRPPELATDAATSLDVCLHALDWYEQSKGPVDGLLLLQPTSPLRSVQTVRRGLELFRQTRRQSVVALSPAEAHPFRCFEVAGQAMRPFVPSAGKNLRSQDLTPAYRINGALYLISPEELRTRRAFYGEQTVPLVIEDPAEGIDIDTEWDWRLAEMVARERGLS